MSNDLISRSALLKELEEKVYPEKYGEKCNALDVINGVLQVIGEHPTAYDVDKVVKKIKQIPEEYSDHDIDSMIYDAIEIVKSGGIE